MILCYRLQCKQAAHWPSQWLFSLYKMLLGYNMWTDGQPHISTHMCVYIYIYIYIYTHTHTHTHTHTYIYIYIKIKSRTPFCSPLEVTVYEVHHMYYHITIHNSVQKMNVTYSPAQITSENSYYFCPLSGAICWTEPVNSKMQFLVKHVTQYWAPKLNVLIFCRLHDGTGVCPMYCSVAPLCPGWMRINHEPYLWEVVKTKFVSFLYA